MDEQVQRIFQIIADKKMNQAQFADAIGVSHGTISHLKGRNKKVSSDILHKIKERFDDINSDWLLTGNGTMIIAPQNQVSGSINGRLPDPEEKKRLNDDEPKKWMASVKKPDLFNTPNAFKQQPDSFTTPVQIVNKQDSNTNIIEKEVIVYKEKPPKTIEKLVIFFSDNTYETFIPGK